MESQNQNLVHGSDIVVAKFGYWPDFHDAECVELILKRAKDTGSIGPTLIAVFHIKRSVGDRDEHHLLTLKCLGVERLLIEEFNYQNAINGLEVSEAKRFGEDDRPLICVEVIPGFGLNGSFRCESIEVADFQQFTPAQSYW